MTNVCLSHAGKVHCERNRSFCKLSVSCSIHLRRSQIIPVSFNHGIASWTFPHTSLHMKYTLQLLWFMIAVQNAVQLI